MRVGRKQMLLVVVLAGLCGIAQAETAGLYVKSETWAETMLASRAAWRAAHEQQVFRPFQSGLLRGGDAPVRVVAEVVGVHTLVLRATVGPDDYNYDQAVWGEAVLIDAQGNETRLSALEPTSCSVGWGVLYRDTNHIKQPLRAGGRAFSHGLWAHAPSELKYALEDRYVRFEAWVGISETAQKNGSAVFELSDGDTSLEGLWKQVEGDFPLECQGMAEDTPEGPLTWFAEGDTLEIEQAMARHCLAELGASSEEKCGSLSAESTPQARLAVYEEMLGRRERLRKLRTGLETLNCTALRKAIEDLCADYPARYAQGKQYLDTLTSCEARLDTIRQGVAAGDPETLQEAEALLALQREALLANPLLDFSHLLVMRRGEKAPALGMPANWQGNCSLPPGRYDDSLCALPLRGGNGFTPIYTPEDGRFLGDVDLHFDADKLLLSMKDTQNRFQIWEMAFTGNPLQQAKAGKMPEFSLRQITPGQEPDVDNYDACYLPDGRIIYASTLCYQGIPCVFGGDSVANLCILDPASGAIRQLCFDQDHNWCPTVLNNGRVMYLRWEYADTPHSNTRLLFSMNPDGTNQMEYYGSNSYWPNSLFFARPVPNHPTMVAGIVTGHHGVRRMGELVLFDPSKGRAEAHGALQRIPGNGTPVEAIFRDKLVDESWPKFLHPYPLSDKYFLVSAQRASGARWGVYLVDVFDNMLLLGDLPGYALLEPIPWRKTPKPPVIPARVDLQDPSAVVYLADVYAGGGLDGVPRGTVKSLRLFSYAYAYRGMGGLLGMVGMDGPWDVRRILGTVPVDPDGSALFRVPANTPIAVQPLDGEGKAVQQMRSWFTAMPGETLSCVGCHEQQNTPPPARVSTAALRTPAEIEPWYGPARGFSFAREVQPVLDAYCVRCHGEGEAAPDLRGDTMITDWNSQISGHASPDLGGRFSQSYAELHRYVRRNGIEGDYHMLEPMEFHADTTELVQLLRKGHHGVRLDEEAWSRLVTWIDFNAPFHGRWTDMLGEQRVASVAKRCRELRKQYAGVDVDHEYLPEQKTGTVASERRQERDGTVPAFCEHTGESRKLDGAAPACSEQKTGTVPSERHQERDGTVPAFCEHTGESKEPNGTPPATRTLDLGGGHTLEMVRIPAGEFIMGGEGSADECPPTPVTIDHPFWISRFEISNGQYAQFDPGHDSRVEHKHGYQFGVHGYPLNQPEQPVVRVSWDQAMDFCAWLSKRLGEGVTLPTEAQWEYACRAGAGAPFFFGNLDDDYSAYANVADEKLAELVSNPYFVDNPLPNPNRYDDWIPRDHHFNDGALLSTDISAYQPNHWGLHNMHGNVWEWTLSAFRAYPYAANDGRNALDTREKRTVRGGSWYDRPQRATASYRLPYQPWQRVFNVGFRVVCTEE